ncbi:MAG: hypothetical protein M1820_000538 [Bogoriella megaspora]|nr:MAG: hypothetical protein M1820_000538 [Bogoriella megaspora]
MSSNLYYTQGLTVPPGQPLPSRKNFNEWVMTPNSQDSIQVSLFIRALIRFYKMDYHDATSYFQVAGIHGSPTTLSWNNEPPQQYCVHGLNTFPTWHRPYMLLFESLTSHLISTNIKQQRISELMTEVIENELTFEHQLDKDAWTKEAEQWRLPYWDWAVKYPKSTVPDLFTTETVTICAPKGSAHNYDKLDNPLARYQLRDKSGKPELVGSLELPYTIEDNSPYPWSKCSGTSRWAVTDHNQHLWAPGINNWAKADDAISAHNWYHQSSPAPPGLSTSAIGELVARMLTPGVLQSYRQFATTGYNAKDPWIAYLSLEYIHNNLHNWIGGTDLSDGAGQMGDVPVAAFDPIFWMHHCNIDRLFAIWQTLNPGLWWAPGDSPQSNEKLTPFYHKFPTTIDIFDSDNVRDWTQFGYQYDTLQHKPGQTDKEYIQGIREYIDQNYATTAPVLLHDPASIGRDKLVTSEHEFHDYIIDVIYDRLALGGAPYTLYFFLGDTISTNISTIKTTNEKLPRFVGSVYTFSRRLTGGNQPHCANCARQANEGSLSTAQIVLTDALYYHVAAPGTGLDRMAPDQVQPYLEQNLQWVAVSASGDVVDMQHLPRTKVFVLKGKVQHYRQHGTPSDFERYVAMASVTNGKPGGASPGEYV